MQHIPEADHRAARANAEDELQREVLIVRELSGKPMLGDAVGQRHRLTATPDFTQVTDADLSIHFERWRSRFVGSAGGDLIAPERAWPF